MLRVAEHVARTDTGHQRTTNEDSHLARAPVFVVADGMGGARAGEVASQLAIGHFAEGLPSEDGEGAEQRLARAVRAANAEIHALSERDARRAGMGTTLTAAYVGRGEVSIAHVGDSRAYRFHDGKLQRLTQDHSLVEEMIRQGQLTEEEAEEHPQRSIITRALYKPDREYVRHRSASNSPIEGLSLKQDRPRHDLQARTSRREKLESSPRSRPVAESCPRCKVQRRNRGRQIASSSRCRLTHARHQNSAIAPVERDTRLSFQIIRRY